MSLNTRIKGRREELGMTRQDLAKKFDNYFFKLYNESTKI